MSPVASFNDYRQRRADAIAALTLARGEAWSKGFCAGVPSLRDIQREGGAVVAGSEAEARAQLALSIGTEAAAAVTFIGSIEPSQETK